MATLRAAEHQVDFPSEKQSQTKRCRTALLDLLREADSSGYDFIAPTPASHLRVAARADREVGNGIIDLLGWSLPCRMESIAPSVVACLEAAGKLDRRRDGLIAADVRLSRIFGNLFLHSKFPTSEQDAVFLGPDSHRFADYILRNIHGITAGVRVLDYGAGAGVGGITAASSLDRADLTLADINPKALILAGINASYAALEHCTLEASTPADLDGEFELIVMHPPFMIDLDHRAYRDGGDLYGGRLSLDWAIAGMERLAPGGRLIMHTGVSIVGGCDVVHQAFAKEMPKADFTLEYSLLDPDIFGDELGTAAYADVDRIAAVGICIERVR